MHGASGSRPAQRRAWWKESSVYQIYPSSFQDSTGNGVGDLRGIISRVDYIKNLGADIVWLSPIFQSPKIDMGYDVSDYRVIDPQYGSIDDVDELKEKLHERGMKLVLDLVVNHTSDQHEWFRESRKSRDNPFRDWYIWRPPKVDAAGNRSPPNNWDSHFQGSTWTFDEATGEYYLHLFCKEQPDLNWENPKVRDAVHEVIRFWLDRGIDGFRMDVINFISKDQRFQDSSASVLRGSELYSAGPRLHEYLGDIGKILQEYDAFSVGEMPCVSDEREIIKSVGEDRGELSMIFNFDLVELDYGVEGKFSPRSWTLRELKAVVTKWQKFMYENRGWNALYIENHDQPRSVSRYASDAPEHRVNAAKMLAMFLGLQAGTPFIYQGQELGMTNVPKGWPMEEFKDIDCLNHWNLYTSGQRKATPEELEAVKQQYEAKSRDNARVPMHWDSEPHAGFTRPESTPWMTANPNYGEINAASQLSDSDSVFNCWKAVLALRKSLKDVFVYGDFDMIDPDNDKVLAYTRRSDEGAVAAVVCNFSAERVNFEGLPSQVREVLLSNGARAEEGIFPTTITLGPYEGTVLRL